MCPEHTVAPDVSFALPCPPFAIPPFRCKVVPTWHFSCFACTHLVTGFPNPSCCCYLVTSPKIASFIFAKWDCNLAGLLQNGNPTENQVWPRNGQRNGRRPFFQGGPNMARKWPGKWPDRQPNFSFPDILPSHFMAILEPLRKMAASHFAGHFWFWARFPFCSRPAVFYLFFGYMRQALGLFLTLRLASV